MKKETTKKVQQETWTDVHNDALMVELGFRNPSIDLRDPSVWTKTPNERKMLKWLRDCKDNSHFHFSHIKPIPVRDKLIIQLRKNNKFPKSTYSIECWQHEIPYILSKYRIMVNNKNAIIKYSFNGMTYAPDEIPFWRL